MDRTLQSGLEKRTRVGGWSSRVYRLERGYLSAWADVSRVAAKEEPSRTECLFEGNQVAKLTDQGDRRFKLDFPWDSSRNLQLRANNLATKKAWMDVLKATLKEISAQIQGTGAVFAYGGAAHHEKDQAYEEATILRTNRFMAAYVVDEDNRMSYINDMLNESFHQTGERSVSGLEIHRACVGANIAIEELLALIHDFNEEMQGLEELRRDRGGGRSARDAAVLAPKIQRFCEQHLELVGRLVASRLMLELSPFMDTSVVATSSAPASPSRQQLVATRGKLDEAYTVAEHYVVMGTRDWLMDIRGSLLDCEGLATASSSPSPTCNSQVNGGVKSAEASRAALENRASQTDLSSGFSSARVASKDARSVVSGVTVAESSDIGDVGKGQEETVGRSSRRLVQSLFRRGSRPEREQPLISSPQTSPLKHGQDNVGSTSTGRLELAADTGERERWDLFGGSSKSAGESPLPTLDAVGQSSVLPKGEKPVNAVSTTSASSPPQLQKAEGGRKIRRAFAGGLWNRGGDSAVKGDPRGDRPHLSVDSTREATTTTTTTAGAHVAEQTSPPVVDAVAGAPRSNVAASTAAKPSGGKRRFAGGVFSGPAAAASGRGVESASASATGAPSFAASIQDVPTTREKERSPNPSAESVPAWATEGGHDIPSWATDSKANGVSSGSDGAKPDGFGVAPPSRDDQGQEAAGKSPFMIAEVSAPAVRRPSQRPGESGRAKRAFGGGKSLF